MKYWLLVVLWILPSAALGQKADRRAVELLGKGDYFALRNELPALKERGLNPALGCMSDAMLGSAFNRPAEAVEAFDSLLVCYAEALSPDTRVGMESLRGINMMLLGRYGAAADRIGEFLGEVDDPQDYMFSCGFILRTCEALRDRPAGTLERPQGDVRVPFRTVESGRGEALLVPATVDGHPGEFIFDTGCSFFNFVTERFALENGVEIIADSIPITGMGSGFVKLGVADSLSVGALTYRNPVFMVAPNDSIMNVALPTGAVLGSDFLRAAGRIVFRGGEGAVEFPAAAGSPAPEGPNMFMNANQLYARLTFRGRPLTMHFDTGNVKSNFYSSFYDRFGRWIRRHGQKDETRYGGYGDVRMLSVYRLPRVELELSGRGFGLAEAETVVDWDGFSDGYSDGSLGMDFVKAFDTLTLDYENMYLSGDGANM